MSYKLVETRQIAFSYVARSQTTGSSGPFVFDTSAESYLSAPLSEVDEGWLARYLELFPVYVGVVTVVERARGYLMARDQCLGPRRIEIEQMLLGYIGTLQFKPSRVLDLTSSIALVSAQLMSLLPEPPSPPHRSHREAESRQDRLSRWRFDIMIAATALVNSLPLIHNNPRDFEAMRMMIETVPERFPGVGPLNLISVKRLAA